jgi:prolyl-tRNA editing enzyme YbaK/EbsC (Cys-tRNA(Pro) deacylase)
VSDSVERVRAALLAAGHDDTITMFPDGTRTAQDAASAVGCAVAQIAKSIVLRAGEQVVLVIASGANRVDVAKVAARLGRPVKPADGRWVRDVTGFAIGGVALRRATFAILTGLPTEAPRSAKVGAGEGIRTLDPDLGKVVLYP